MFRAAVLALAFGSACAFQSQQAQLSRSGANKLSVFVPNVPANTKIVQVVQCVNTPDRK